MNTHRVASPRVPKSNAANTVRMQPKGDLYSLAPARVPSRVSSRQSGGDRGRGGTCGVRCRRATRCIVFTLHTVVLFHPNQYDTLVN